MALGSTQSLTEMSTRNLLWGKGRPAHKADNFTAIYEPTIQKKWEPQRLKTLRASTAFYTDSFTCFALIKFGNICRIFMLHSLKLNAEKLLNVGSLSPTAWSVLRITGTVSR
jgi:hypothetical protein